MLQKDNSLLTQNLKDRNKKKKEALLVKQEMRKLHSSPHL